jgi:hypothetical protein
MNDYSNITNEFVEAYTNDFKKMGVKQLRDLCKSVNISRYSRLRKAELCDMMRQWYDDRPLVGGHVVDAKDVKTNKAPVVTQGPDAKPDAKRVGRIGIHVGR